MPDVRHGCAAQSSALNDSRHCQSSSRAGTSQAHRLNVLGSRRSPLPSRARLVVGHSPARFPRLPRTERRASNTVDASPTLARRPPAPSPPGHPVLFVVAALNLRRRIGRRATLRVAESLAMPSFVPLTASGSAPPHQRTGLTDRGPSCALRSPRSSSPRPASIRPCLTPACSGLAALATDARR
jgi:hypothetical protein